MPIRQWIEKDRRRIRAVVSGNFTISDIIRAIDTAIQDPEFEPGFDVLSDHSDVGEPIAASEVREMTSHLATLSKHMANSRWAVITQKPASYGMMRVLSVLAERIPMKVEVFESAEEAERWLSSAPAGTGPSESHR